MMPERGNSNFKTPKSLNKKIVFTTATPVNSKATIARIQRE